MNELKEIKRLLSLCSKADRRKVFEHLRVEFPIHPLELKLNSSAEIILEAIDRASDLSLRGVRGLLAEAAFKLYVLDGLRGWTVEELQGDFPFDFQVRDDKGPVRITAVQIS